MNEELLADEKERAEHVMLVDLARNDMGRISRIRNGKGNRVYEDPQLFPCDAHRIHGRGKKKRQHFIHLIFWHPFLPAGTLSGAPKIRAMEIIEELETVRTRLIRRCNRICGFFRRYGFLYYDPYDDQKRQRKSIYRQVRELWQILFRKMNIKECCNKVMALAKTLVEEENL